MSEKSWWWKLVEFGFRLLYHEMAFTYDAVSWFVSLGQWHEWQRSALSFLPPKERGLILEIAHGTGNLQIDLAKAQYQSVAYDFSPQMGRIAKAKNPQAQFVRGMAQKLPFQDGSFSAIVSTFPTSFIVAPESLREAYRVLEPGGRMVVVLNGMLFGGSFVVKFLEWLYRITGQRQGYSNSLEELFGGYGFRVEAQEVRLKNSLAQLVILEKQA